MILPKLPLDQVLLGDCLTVLESLAENSVDLIFADPPYNLQLKNELWRPNMTRVDGVDDAWDQFASFPAYDEFSHAWMAACRRVLKDTGTIWVIGSYHNIFRLGTILQDLGFWVLNDVVWIKTNPMPNFRGVRFTNAHETLIWAQKRRGAHYTFNHQGMKSLNDDLQMRSDWYLPLCTGKERLKVNGEKAHATQKPEALLYRVILSSTNPGDVVLDPFFGTGTTGAVAKKLQRHWIGIERDQNYIQVAKQRLEAIQPDVSSGLGFTFERKRDLPRVPFVTLLEHGLLQLGQTLFFEKQLNRTATVQANGQIRYREVIGSIHQVARAIQKAPCNGWTQWYYQDAKTGNYHPIDELRQIIRKGMAGE